ncbi:MAG TPA: ATP-binding protein [Burkholderiales bacterium]|nr:ATP-binding protein [Burkholderiales bacterium]
MLQLRNLSLRYKIPLRGTVLVLITAVIVTGSLIFREYDELKQDLLVNAASLGRVLATTLVTPIAHDDAWRAYEIISSPFQPGTREHAPQSAELLMILDPDYRVYVSTRPTEFPMLTDPGSISADYRAVQDAIRARKSAEPFPLEIAGSETLYVITPIIADGVSLGTLVAAYSTTGFLPRFFNIAQRGALVTLLVLAILLPGAWYWGSHFATPLVQLAENMGKIGSHIPADTELEIYESRDEVGQVGSAFRRMVSELRRKEALEQEVLLSERLAAVGRLSAGIAHEINNPLGGMLNAISTFKRHGNPDAAVALLEEREACGRCDLPNRLVLGGKTLSLLERGLTQIKDTVGALLVEARADSHPVSAQDIEDTRTLVQPDVHRKRASLDWDNGLREPVALPSTLVRQVLLNLLLNAVQAVEPGGRVACRVYRNSDTLVLSVGNDGAHIPPEHRQVLFEPFTSGRPDGHGLGLWVTYQIVSQLGGEIAVASEPGDTRFTVQLPVAPPVS